MWEWAICPPGTFTPTRSTSGSVFWPITCSSASGGIFFRPPAGPGRCGLSDGESFRSRDGSFAMPAPLFSNWRPTGIHWTFWPEYGGNAMRSSVRPDIKGLTRKPGDDSDTRSRRGATISVPGETTPMFLTVLDSGHQKPGTSSTGVTVGFKDGGLSPGRRRSRRT